MTSDAYESLKKEMELENATYGFTDPREEDDAAQDISDGVLEEVTDLDSPGVTSIDNDIASLGLSDKPLSQNGISRPSK